MGGLEVRARAEDAAGLSAADEILLGYDKEECERADEPAPDRQHAAWLRRKLERSLAAAVAGKVQSQESVRWRMAGAGPSETREEATPVKEHDDFSEAKPNPYAPRLQRQAERAAEDHPPASVVPARAVALSAVRAHLGRWLARAASGPLVITRRGRPVGVLIGCASEADWLEYRERQRPPSGVMRKRRRVR
jgi:prevent-host-death family protein